MKKALLILSAALIGGSSMAQYVAEGNLSNAVMPSNISLAQEAIMPNPSLKVTKPGHGPEATFDVQMTGVQNIPYTIVPFSQIFNLGTVGLITNVGTQTVTNVSMTVNVYDGSQANVYNATSNVVASVAPQGQAQVAVPGYMPIAPDNYLLEFITNINETDNDRTSDTARLLILISDSIYAKDNGQVSGYMSLGPTLTGEIGQLFALPNNDTMTSVSVFIGNGTGAMTGQPFSVNVYGVTNGAIDPTILGSSQTVNIDASVNKLWEIPMQGNGLAITTVDSIIVAAVEADSSITIGTTPNIYRPVTTFVRVTGQGWVPLENVGPMAALALRPNFGAGSCIASTSSRTITECKEYTGPSGTVYTTSGVHYDVIDNSAQTCDSIIEINLTIIPFDVTINVTGGQAVSNEAAATAYQWIDCSNGTPIAGETNSVYNAATNGLYAVIMTKNGCTDTSDCATVSSVGLNDAILANKVSIYPNPSNGLFEISLDNVISDRVNFEVLSMDGKVVASQSVIQSVIGSKISFDLNNLDSGTYFVRVIAEDVSTMKKLLIIGK